jgi:hypothetical protein
MKTTENTKKTYVAPRVEVLGVVMCNLLSGSDSDTSDSSDFKAFDKPSDPTVTGESSLGKRNTPWGNSGMWDNGK